MPVLRGTILYMLIALVVVAQTSQTKPKTQPKTQPKQTQSKQTQTAETAKAQALTAKYPAECVTQYVFPHWYPEVPYSRPTSGGNYELVNSPDSWELQVYGEHCHFDKKPPSVPVEFARETSKVTVQNADWATIHVPLFPTPKK